MDEGSVAALLCTRLSEKQTFRAKGEILVVVKVRGAK